MDVNPLQRKVVASEIAPERLAGNSSLSQREKIGEASRQFESMLLRQILENSQKSAIKSKYNEESMSSSIYRDQISTQLADSISKSGSFGLAKTFAQQLNRPADTAATNSPAPLKYLGISPRKNGGHISPTRKTS